jgi:Uma2 family endonuclease
MPTILFDDAEVRIPEWVRDRPSFQRWLRSDDFPETGRIAFLAGEVWADMSKEQLFSHNQLKQEFNLVLGGLAKADKHGRWFPDGAMLGNAEVDFTSRPDGTFVTRETFATGKVRCVEAVKEGFLELEGTPDMVFEAISDSSVQKDTVLLRRLYWEAGIQEYWLVDVRGDRLRFEILRWTAKGYVSVRRQQGWLRSEVFGKSFNLSRDFDEDENPEYTLSWR